MVGPAARAGGRLSRRSSRTRSWTCAACTTRTASGDEQGAVACARSKQLWSLSHLIEKHESSMAAAKRALIYEIAGWRCARELLAVGSLEAADGVDREFHRALEVIADLEEADVSRHSWTACGSSPAYVDFGYNAGMAI